MNSTSATLDWNHVRAFLATAEHGSLSAAARKLGQTQPTLSRQVAALESRLGILLFERVGRRLQMTNGGRELLAQTRIMGDAADRLALAALGQSQSISGEISITASDVFSAFLLPPVLHRLRGLAPHLKINVVADNDIRDILKREADIAIRHSRPTQPDLIARLVRQATAHFYASSGYLKLHGRPKTLADMGEHDFVSIGSPQQMLDFMLPLGLPLDEGNFPVGSQNGIVAWELVKQDFGIMIMADEVAALTTGIERVLPQMEPVEFPVWLVTHRELHTSRRIRLVFDLLAEAMGQSAA
ncbi:LysR family transcriptional regulator [Profundibacter amoris]|uniref:LysR family transcriptional regulator n=1 Tax=Profundibacter amoris TaxID=2171755 RepID=A0A347UDB8_9RHOB|nr:LysR family transcriptional regulator [Profundibacter amoris]AXX96846.1 LysR family transcriptional regulator [Profundibacter amoris]